MSKRELHYLMMHRWIANCKESNGLIIKVIIIRTLRTEIYGFVFGVGYMILFLDIGNSYMGIKVRIIH